MQRLLLLALLSTHAFGATVFLDFDTPATGSNIIGAPLVTALGTITAVDAQLTTLADPDFTTAGASGNNIDILTDSVPSFLTFDFDVSSITLIYGGNNGDITINVRNAANVIVDSFFQASTGDGQPAGPIVLSGLGIRSLEWLDLSSGAEFAPLDNLTIADSAVPEPGTFLLSGLGLIGLGFLRRKTRLQNQLSRQN